MKRLKLPSLSQKLFLTFILSFIFPLILTVVFLSYLFSNYQRHALQVQSQSDLRLISTYLSNYMNDVNNVTKALYYNPYFQSRTDLSQMSIGARNALSEEIGNTLTLTAYSRDDFGDLLFISDREVLYFNAVNYYQYLSTVQPLETRSWYTEALEKEGKVAITPCYPQESGENSQRADSFFISRQLKNLYDPDQENIIMINMKTQFLDTLFSQLGAQTPCIILFTNDRGELLYSSQAVDQEFLSHMGDTSFRYRQDTWSQEVHTLENYPLTIHMFHSTAYIRQQITAFVTVGVLCLLIAACLAYLLFRRNNRWIKEPVNHIQAVLGEMEQGNLEARCRDLPIREFQKIGSSVNHMAAKLQEKIRNEYELLIAQKNLQFQALQSQIRPHFIINTIYSFITLNQIGETELLNDCFYKFANILRYVLSKEQNTTLGKELDFLDSYCALFHLRFGDRIRYSISCDDSLRDLPMPKLLLQPLVENAVIHGIEPSEVPCTLNLTVQERGNKIYIIIEDSGVGFTPEQLTSPTSIGLKNVENRIQLWSKEVKFYMYRIDGLTIQAVIIPESAKGGTQ